MNVTAVLMFGAVAAPAAVALVASVAAARTGTRTPERWWLLSVLALGVTSLLTLALAVLLVVDGPATTRFEIVASFTRRDVGIGFTVRSDVLSVTVGLLNVALTLGVLVYTRTAGPHGRRFHVAYLLFTAAVFGIVFSGDLLVTFVALLGLIAAMGRLIGCGDKAGAGAAARNYRRTATAGATVYLSGVLLTMWLGGSSDGHRLGTALADVGYTESSVVVAFVLTTVGLATLVALVPLHGWLVEAHARSTDPVSALVSGILPAAAVYAFIRVLFDVFTIDFLAHNPAVTTGMVYAALGSLLVGNLLAYGQRDVKGMLAYSTVSQFGLILAGLLAATESAIFGSVIQLFGHGLVKAAFCLIAGIIAIRFDARTIDEFDGIADRAPVLAASFVGLGIAMIGLPPTVGFVGKWYIAVGAFEQGLWAVTGFVVLSTVLTLGYVLPFVDRLYFGSFDGTDHGRETVTTGMIAVVVFAVLISVALGLASVLLESLLREAIDGLTAARV